MCAYISNLHYRDVSVQHSKGEGCPVAAIGMHRGVFWGARWHLAARKQYVLHKSRWNCLTIMITDDSILCRFARFKADVKHIYRHVKVGPRIDQHLD